MINKREHPPQKQKKQPGREYKMHPKPIVERHDQASSNKLKNKFAIITGGDSGIGRAVAIAFAKEGADIAIIYLNEHADAKETAKQVMEEGQDCILIACDLRNEVSIKKVINALGKKYKSIDILVNNAAEQHPQKNIEDISSRQLEKTFQTNIFSFFYVTKAALKFMKKGSTIINTTSVTAYRGNEELMDYSATKGAIVAFTRSLAKNLAKKSIRVNAVAPGPIWTPLIPATFDKKKMKTFGKKTLLGRPGEPVEVAPSYVFLASEDASYMTGQVLHPNGGEIING